MAAPLSRHKSLGKLVFERSSFLDKNDRHKEHIRNHYFNSSCSIFLPTCEAIPKDVDGLLTDRMVYLAKKVPLYMLIEPEFIEGFVKRGEVYMQSHGACIDTEDCAAFLPTGVLLLNVCKDTYLELGLEGHRYKVDTAAGKYVIELDLKKDQRLTVGKKFYDRVQWCLKERLRLTLDFLLMWNPQDERVCPSSIQNYFKSQDVTCSRITIPRAVYHYQNLSVPVINPEHYSPEGGSNKSVESCDFMEVFDWLGACACGIDLGDARADGFVSTCTTPTPSHPIGQAVVAQYRGMVAPYQIQSAVEALRTCIRRKKIPWCSVTVHGFVDSPVSWQQRDHGFHSNGDNLYTLLIFETEDYWLYSAVGGEDICP